MAVSRAAVTSPRRPVPAPERPRLEVIRGRPASGRRPPTLFAVVTALACGGALFALVFAQVLLGQAGIKQAELEQRVAAKQTDVDQLRLEVTRLRAPEHIASAAHKLGLVEATDVSVLSVTPTAPAAIARVTPTVRGPSPKRGRP